MTTPEDRKRASRLRKLEEEINREHRTRTSKVNSEPSLHQTRKHQPKTNAIQRFGHKIVRYAKFIGFVIAGIAIIRAGFFIGMWLTYLAMAGIIAFIGYQIFLQEDD